ncbi:MAG: Asp-tRNA(Asn)/Glu-tRNA(Gln) amidotransferase subunit GatC [Acidibacillus sp.]|uniref:Aspartyl/glutamyl-tRNA(Asn/Gln) amidotransferase subunit C n=1 Tax=Sulfoacidibacillus ferrooxidans TaxID=2005001 RepID=A0A9X1V7Q5_9BACL|nr:Aspartyl/glutamyl-tRNA(Asn/Gln) amidotransferase subunit C [Sulfoacidibacillus ferrooxidans]MCY0894173.1 Asp-tRNA(Asn)/Glu-tRNA(Gln) amidotransferase subunit GatC [Acidibacillus sp.]
MSLSRQDVLHVASLARLEVNEAEMESLVSDLTSILEYAEELQQLDLTGVLPMSYVGMLQTVTRPDVVGSSLSDDEALANGPDVEEQQFRVPAVLEG